MEVAKQTSSNDFACIRKRIIGLELVNIYGSQYISINLEILCAKIYLNIAKIKVKLFCAQKPPEETLQGGWVGGQTINTKTNLHFQMVDKIMEW